MKALKLFIFLFIGIFNNLHAKIEDLKDAEPTQTELIMQILEINDNLTISDLEQHFGQFAEDIEVEKLNDLLTAAANGIDGLPILK